MDEQIHLSIVRPTAFQRAVRNIRHSAEEGNAPGFTFGHVGPLGKSFYFLALEANFSAALYVKATGVESPHEMHCDSGSGYDEGTFVGVYLKAVAHHTGLHEDQLVAHFANRRSWWRFSSWDGAAFDTTRDNGDVWRRGLWPLALEIVQVAPPCLYSIPLLAGEVLRTRLGGHANEGMIVLDP